VIYAPLNGEVLKMTIHDRHGLKNQVLNPGRGRNISAGYYNQAGSEVTSISAS
jgi:allantoicase